MRILVAALSLVGCTPAPPPEPPPPEPVEGLCNATPVQDLIGRPRSDSLGAEALRRSGSRTLRWIAPGAVITQDLRSDRINIDVDARDRVTRLRCF